MALSNVRIVPTSNGYLVMVEDAMGRLPAAESAIVVEAAGKNPADVNSQLGAAVITLANKEVAPK